MHYMLIKALSPVLPDNRPIAFKLSRQEGQQGNKPGLSHKMSCARWTWRGWQFCTIKKQQFVNPSELKFPRNIYIRVCFIARHIKIHVFGNIDLLRSSHTKSIEHGLAYDLRINGNFDTYRNDNMEYSIGGLSWDQGLVMKERRDCSPVSQNSPFCRWVPSYAPWILMRNLEMSDLQFLY